jgi:hypoxanthine-guanine phosphoribosyltransferase
MSSSRLVLQKVSAREPLSFAKEIYAANIFTKQDGGEWRTRQELTELIIDFSRAGFLGAPDLATLAVFVRRVAEDGKPVTINWPRLSHGKPGRLEQYLEKLRFAELFDRAANAIDWRYRVRIRGRTARSHYPADPHDTTHYVPLRWFDRRDFLLVGEPSIWKERPSVLPSVEREFHDVLLQQSFADIETTDLLCRVVFLELAFNTVLHSAINAGEGTGAFCVQIRHNEGQTPLLTFCIADAGRGIPVTLRAAYENAIKGGDYYADDTKSANANIVRFALENSSSSRLEYPSNIDLEAARGLALVADSLMRRGRLAIRSDGGTVRLETVDGEPRFIIDDSFKKYPITGTQVIGTIQASTRRQSVSTTEAVIARSNDVQAILACEPDGSCPVLSSAETARNFVESVEITKSNILIVDLGYGDAGVRHLEYLCRPMLLKFPKQLVMFWNVSADWSQFADLDKWIANSILGSSPPPLFVRGPGDARTLGLSDDSWPSRWNWEGNGFGWYGGLLRADRGDEKDEVGVRVGISLDDYLRLTSDINTAHLTDGFRKEAITSGFFSGKIHLLSTRTVRRYFSISNHIAASVDANLKRWIASGIANLAKLLRLADNDSRVPVILAFAEPMRHVLPHIPKQLPFRTRGHTILTYDVPTREEISSYVRVGDEVVLLTDVVSTGSLLDAVADSVLENSARILGVVALVNHRQDARSHLNTITLRREEVPFLAAAEFPRGNETKQYLLTDREYWVDPVTFIPQDRRPWGWDAELDPRVEQTLSLVIESQAVRCGHIVDGARHSSVYVDTKALLTADTGEIVRQVRAIYEQRLASRGWQKFNPRIVLYPSGIRRIESVDLSDNADNDSELMSYATAVGLYCDRLKSIWGQDIAVGEVPRTFDPGGGARCSEQVLFPYGDPVDENWTDVVVADDGIWRGITMASLIRIAIKRGAQRVLAIPLLARLTPKDAEAAETICAVEEEKGGRQAAVCYVFPFVLPIPFYSAHECPYEMTQRRLRERDWVSDAVRQVAISVSHTLDGRNPKDVELHSETFTRTWVSLRSYAELASENEAALDQLANNIDRSNSDEELLALFSLFLEEWRLLGKARLRQTIGPRVKQRAEYVLKHDHSAAVKAAALSLLRSQFTAEFVDALDNVSELALRDVNVLGRAVLHIATLTPRQRSSEECSRFCDLVQDRGPLMAKQAGLGETALSQYTDLVGACSAMSLQRVAIPEAAGRSPRWAAMKVLDLIRDDTVLRHDIRPFINPLAKRGESLVEVSAKTFALYAKDWKERHRDYLAGGLLAALEVLRPCLLQIGATREASISHVQYLTSSRAGTLHLAEDIGLVTFVLEYLGTGDRRKSFVINLSQIAERLATHLLNENSTLVRLLSTFRVIQVGAFAETYRDRIAERIKAVCNLSSTPNVEIEGFSNVDRSRFVFAPADVLDLCAAHVLHNLETKAFKKAEEEECVGDPQILLAVEEGRNALADPCVIVTVKNNGIELTDNIELSPRGRRLARRIQSFGGNLERPVAIQEHPWCVAQRIWACLW